jgi:hypothetical protein
VSRNQCCGNRLLGGAEFTNIWKTADGKRHHFGGFHSDENSNAIQSLPDPADQEFACKVGMILAGLRKLESALSDAATRSRTTPAVIVALSSVRNRYDDLTATGANGPGAPLGQRLYVARGRAKLSRNEAGKGIGMRADLIEAIEVEETPTEDEAGRVKELIAALGG